MRFRPSATVVLGTAAVLLVIAFAWSLRAFSRYQPYDLLSAASARPSISFGLALQDVNLQGCQHGRRLWTFHAARIILSQDRTTASADLLTGGLLYQNFRPVVAFDAGHAQADLGRFGPPTGMLTLSGTVRLRSLGAATRRLGSELTVTAPSLIWNGPRGLVECAGPAVAHLGSLGALTATSLAFDTRARILFVGSLSLVAQSPNISAAAPPAADAKAPTEKSVVHIDAPEGGTLNEETRVVTLRGPVTFTQGDSRMETVGGTYDQRAAFARSQSPVTLKDPDMTLAGDQGTVDFNRHIATLAGDIHLTVKPKPEEEKDSDTVDKEARQPTVMTCDQIVYNYKTKQADATGHFVIHQKDRTVTAEMGHYDATAEIATLKAPVKYTTTDGQSLTALSDAVVSLKPGHGSVDVTGPLNGDFPVNNQNGPPLPGH